MTAEHRMTQPTIVLIGGLPVVLKAPAETLKLATQAALARAERNIAAALAAGRKREANRIALSLEQRMKITAADRIEATRESASGEDWEKLVDQAIIAATRAIEMPAPKRSRSRGRPPGKPKPAKRGRQTPKFSDVPTPERARRSDLEEVPDTMVVAGEVRPDRKWDEDAIPAPRTIIAGYMLRDREAKAKVRLQKFRDLKPEQIAAGVRFETDWETSGLEPRMTANLMGVGGGSGASPGALDGWGARLSDTVIKARNSVHLAVQALRLGGEEVSRVVEAIVLRGESSGLAGSSRYADAARANAHVAACLAAGLNLLAMHYKLRSKIAQTATSARERA